MLVRLENSIEHAIFSWPLAQGLLVLFVRSVGSGRGVLSDALHLATEIRTLEAIKQVHMRSVGRSS